MKAEMFPYKLDLAAAEDLPDSSLATHSDEQLLRAALRGNKSAFGNLFSRYARDVRAIGYRILRDRGESEDLLQELFSQAGEKWSTFDRAKGSLRSWILAMTYNAAISRRRYLNSRRFYANVEIDHAEQAGFSLNPPNASHGTDVEIEKTKLRRLFSLLTQNQGRTLELFFCEGYTLDEIAAESGQSKGNVRHHYFRGLEKLRKEVFCKKAQSPAV